jgi:HEAT repeat protein
MDLKKHLRDRNLKWNWDEIAKYCMNHPESIRLLVEYCEDEEMIIQQNAGAVLGKLVDLDKSLVDPYADQMIRLLDKNVHDAVKRAVLRVYQFAKIPEDVEGEIFDFAIQSLKSSESPIAIKAFSMTAARRICEKYPELANELIPLIEIIVEQKASAGLVNRGSKELKKLHKLKLTTLH